jgi:4-hydroxybenzoate polyprenyltransferase
VSSGKRQRTKDESEVNNESDSRLRLRSGSMIRSYIELMRLPNVFTAMADVAMGFLLVQQSDWQWDGWHDSWTLALLLAASSVLYMSGVVLNDVFDLDTDRRQRPERPLPSGRVSLSAARWLGWTLLLSGVLLGVAGVSVGTRGGIFAGHFGSVAVAPLLAASILIYDAWLKRTPLGPLAMGSCRMFNVLLGMSAAGVRLPADCWLAAGGIGVYVAGLTWFARRESQRSSRLQLTLAALMMALGSAMLICLPNGSDRTIVGVAIEPGQWYLWTGILGLAILSRFFWAIIDPAPARVQTAVALGVLSIVMLDALACFAMGHVHGAGMILLLLLPAMFLGRSIKMT